MKYQKQCCKSDKKEHYKSNCMKVSSFEGEVLSPEFISGAVLRQSFMRETPKTTLPRCKRREI